MSPLYKPVILDNDVICVLFLTGALERLLSVWPHRSFFVTDQVRTEANLWKSHGEELISTITIDESSEEEISAYATLCLAKKIGMGESASIAIAQNRGYDVATNDGDAREQSRELYPSVKTIGSGSLLNWAIADGLIPEAEGIQLRKAMDQYFLD